MNQDNTIRFSVSLPQELLEEMDRKIDANHYVSRSEYVRDMIREKLVEEKWAGREEVVGVLTIIYDHHQHELAQKMIDIQHTYLINVLCSTHIHLDHHNCLETIVIKGEGIRIEEISNDIAGLKGVKFSRLTRTAVLNR